MSTPSAPGPHPQQPPVPPPYPQPGPPGPVGPPWPSQPQHMNPPPQLAPPPLAMINQPNKGINIRETRAWSMNGFLALLLGIIALVVMGIFATQLGDDAESGKNAAMMIVAFIVALFLMTPLSIIQPGQTRVVQFFGKYIGTIRRTGLAWAVPLTSRRVVSVRVNNFETNIVKVNDFDGNPVEIAAIIVWQVTDTAKALFAVENYGAFVAVQSESAVRHVTTTHPYDVPDGRGTSLRGSTDLVSEELAAEVATRVGVAGVSVLEVRISHLAYAPEIAHAMLQRQQAAAVVAAREKIVEGAVTMVQMALGRLEDEEVITMDDERKAAMVSNLLVVLCGDQRATPVVNTGTLHH